LRHSQKRDRQSFPKCLNYSNLATFLIGIVYAILYGSNDEPLTCGTEATMKIALVHDHYDDKHLADVAAGMKTLGAPKIHAVWMECYGHYAALEGCHRIRAAKKLGLTPEIIDVDYSDDMCSTITGYDGDNDYPISEICDGSHNATIIEFQTINQG
jgi:hypothetical protein